MIADLQEVDALGSHPVDEPVLLSDAARPDASPQVLQRLGFADASKRIRPGPLDGVGWPSVLANLKRLLETGDTLPAGQPGYSGAIVHVHVSGGEIARDEHGPLQDSDRDALLHRAVADASRRPR